MKHDLYLPVAAEVLHCIQESAHIFTLQLKLLDSANKTHFNFLPGQFNMVYLYGVGEVAISIVSAFNHQADLTHTIRAVGRVTKALQLLKQGDQIGIRGPFGRPWPVEEAQHKDVIVITGGLGCAPTVSIIQYILQRRAQYGALKILQGVKHSDDFIFKAHYKKWQQSPQTEVLIAADSATPHWPWYIGHITDMIKTLAINLDRTVVMMCGPEMMMHAAILALQQKKVPEDHIYLSMERNMVCGIGHCGHCQYGGYFICKDGPIFAYPEVKSLLKVPGF